LKAKLVTELRAAVETKDATCSICVVESLTRNEGMPLPAVSHLPLDGRLVRLQLVEVRPDLPVRAGPLRGVWHPGPQPALAKTFAPGAPWKTAA